MILNSEKLLGNHFLNLKPDLDINRRDMEIRMCYKCLRKFCYESSFCGVCEMCAKLEFDKIKRDLKICFKCKSKMIEIEKESGCETICSKCGWGIYVWRCNEIEP